MKRSLKMTFQLSRIATVCKVGIRAMHVRGRVSCGAQDAFAFHGSVRPSVFALRKHCFGSFSTNFDYFIGLKIRTNHERQMQTLRRFDFLWCRAVSSTTLETNSASPEFSEAYKKENQRNIEDTIIMDVTNMKCGGCSAAVKRILLKQESVRDASVNLLTGTAVVTLSPNTTQEGVEEIVEAVSDKGFPSSLRTEGGTDEESKLHSQKLAEDKEKFALQFAWVLAVTCYGHHLGHLLHGLGFHEYAHTEMMDFIGNPWVGGSIGAAALLGPGRSLLVDGFQSFIKGNPNMNSLISLGASTSFAAGVLSAVMPGLDIDPSFLEEPVMLLAFVLLGRSLESKARKEASVDLTSLAHLIPSNARLVKDELNEEGSSVKTVMVPTSIIRQGDILQVVPGERIPVDGDIIQGSCSVDESLLTGESRTIEKRPGDKVTGGTVLYDSPILLQARLTGELSTLSSIGRMVEDAQAREAPVQRLADRVAGWFCYGVMTASVSTFAFWSTIGINLFPQVLYTDSIAAGTTSALLSLKLAIDVLVVACPCALGLATPTAVLVATSSAAKRGLLIRGGDVLEKLAEINSVVFDKTGTITHGKIKLINIERYSDVQEDEVLRLAASVESKTIHPLAFALKDIANERGLELKEAKNCRTEAGDGVMGEIDGDSIFVGRKAWVFDSIALKSTDLPSKSLTEVWIGTTKMGVLARLLFSDNLRHESSEVISTLIQQHKNVYLLSGDKVEVATDVGLMAGIPAENILGGQSPEDKCKFVDSLRARGERVAMVGDGVNDAIALSAADVGIAMGKGTDAAGSAANVILLGDRLTQVQESLDIGEATLNKIKQNLMLALVYNAVGIPIAAGVLMPTYGIMLSPTFAAAMMACSSIIVVSNSLLLKKQ